MQSPWAELDAELEASAVASDSGLLGCNEEAPPLKDSPSWYGGKVHFCCKLIQEKSGKAFSLVLEKPYLGPSSRMTRRFGSDKFIRVKIAQSLFYSEGDRLMTFFRRPFIFNLRIYRAFFAKDSTVFLVQTAEEAKQDKDGVYSFHALSAGISISPLPFTEFLDWHNPLHFNQGQVSY